MKRRLTTWPRSQPGRAVLYAVAATALTGAAWWHARQDAPMHFAGEPLHLMPASLQIAQEPEPQEMPAAPLNLEIETDATRAASPAEEDSAPEELRALLPEGAVPASAGAGPDWMAWGRLHGGRIPAEVRLPADIPAEAARVHAVKSPAGATILVANRSDRKVEARARVRLPRGVYCIERLTLSPVPGEAAEPGHLPPDERATMGGMSRDALPPVRLERTTGRDLSQSSVVTKTCLLEPGQAALLRFTDVAFESAVAWNALKRHLEAMRAAAPHTARRLRRMLDAGSPHLARLRAASGRGGSLAQRLSGVHRLLLVTSQAQSLQRNLLGRGTVRGEAAEAVMAALEQVSESLSEVSAAIHGLVPQIALAAEAESGPVTARAASRDSAYRLRLARAQETGEEIARRTVTISLANGGARSVEMVKIGLDVGALPPGVACKPRDPAFFGRLKPGQTVRAAFEVRGPASALSEWACIGDVTYFASSAPAHLRVRAW